MPKKENLTPELKAIFDIIEESGEQGINVIDFFKKLGKVHLDREAHSAIMAQLDELQELGYIYKKPVKEKTKRGVAYCTHWFVVGKGKSLPENFSMLLPG